MLSLLKPHWMLKRAGLAHIHALSPRLIHKDFKTSNVLVDENFIAKVADAGLRNFLGRFDIAGPSSEVAADETFLAPEYYYSGLLFPEIVMLQILNCCLIFFSFVV